MAGQTMANDDDEYKHNEGGETMMRDDHDLMKGRAEEREKMFGFGLAAMAVNMSNRVDFFNFSIYIKII